MRDKLISNIKKNALLHIIIDVILIIVCIMLLYQALRLPTIMKIVFSIIHVFLLIRIIRTLYPNIKTYLFPLKEPVFKTIGTVDEVAEIVEEVLNNCIYEDRNFKCSNKYILDKHCWAHVIAFKDIDNFTLTLVKKHYRNSRFRKFYITINHKENKKYILKGSYLTSYYGIAKMSDELQKTLDFLREKTNS